MVANAGNSGAADLANKTPKDDADYWGREPDSAAKLG
jgi:hypothetical protein